MRASIVFRYEWLSGTEDIETSRGGWLRDIRQGTLGVEGWATK